MPDGGRAMASLLVVLLGGCGLWLTDADLCDPAVDRVRWYPDADADGLGDPTVQGVCEPGPGLVDNAEDCDDQDSRVTSAENMGVVPGLTLWYRDADNDGYGDDDDTVISCYPGPGYSAREGGDCVDDDDQYSLICPWVDVIAGRAWSCGLRANGAVSCWGDTEVGNMPLDALPRTGVDELAGGNFVACARMGDEVRCSLEELEIPLVHPTAISANYAEVCAWTESGNWACDNAPNGPDTGVWLPKGRPDVRLFDISVGFKFACGLTEEREVRCWGDNTSIVDGAPPGGGWVEVECTSYNACALDGEGRVTCWGAGLVGTELDRVPTGTGFSHLAGGRLQMCALDAVGRIHCWSSEDLYGRPPTGSGYVDLAVGGGVDLGVNVGHACAITASGALECWGYDGQGQATVPADYRLEGLGLGGDGSCALLTGGVPVCWGDGPPLQRRPVETAVGGSFAVGLTRDGELMSFGTTEVGPAFPAVASRYTAVGIYSSTTGSDEAICALDDLGRLHCWTSSLNADAYLDLPGSAGWTDVAPGSLHGCALDASGAVACWSLPLVADRIADAPTDSGYLQIAASSLHTCAVHGDGGLTCWGDDSDLGVSGAPAGGDFEAVAVHNDASCALDRSGALSCWGAPGSRVVQEAPVEAAFAQVSVAHDMACALRTDSTVACWGLTDELSPAAIAELDDIVHVSVGRDGLCAVDRFDRLRCVTPGGAGDFEGYVDTGRDRGIQRLALGGGHACVVVDGRVDCSGDDTAGKSTPPFLDHAQVDVVAGRDHSCALDSEGVARCWGDDRVGQASPPAGTWERLAAGDQHTCGLAPGGAVRCWGAVGDPPAGTYTAISSGRGYGCGISGGAVRCWGDSAVVDSTPTGTGFVEVTCGAHHACALREDATVRCWGEDSHGQVSDVPPYAFVVIAAGDEHSCGIKADGFARCWGADVVGQATPPDPSVAR